MGTPDDIDAGALILQIGARISDAGALDAASRKEIVVARCRETFSGVVAREGPLPAAVAAVLKGLVGLAGALDMDPGEVMTWGVEAAAGVASGLAHVDRAAVQDEISEYSPELGQVFFRLAGPQAAVEPESKKLVLIVDDDESVRELLEFYVRKEGFNFKSVADGLQALQQTEALRPDLILLDLMLPQKAGFEVLQQLQQGEHAGIPVIVISARSSDGSLVQMIKEQANVADFLGKPVDKDALISLLRRILGKA